MSNWYQPENVDQLPSPALLIYPQRVRQNLRKMLAMVGDVDKLRPHVKTHKLPQIVRMKRELGIVKFKCSTIAEAEMTASAGGQDVLLAYQPVGPNVHRLIALIQSFPDTRFSALIDNLETLSQLQAAASQADCVVDLFIDLNVGMHRSGIAPGPAVMHLYQAVVDNRHTTARGLHAYDGHLKNRDHELLRRQVAETFAPVWELAEQIEQRLGTKPTIVAGGTPTSAILAEHPNVEVGMGTPVLWDYGQAQVCPEQDFQSAAVLMTRVVSRPAPNRLCLDLGHKAVASEMPQPRVYFLNLDDAQPVMHSEEHLVIETSRAAEFPPGTPLFAIPHHICPSVALHQSAWIVEGNQIVDQWSIEARNRRLYI